MNWFLAALLALLFTSAAKKEQWRRAAILAVTLALYLLIGYFLA